MVQCKTGLNDGGGGGVRGVHGGESQPKVLSQLRAGEVLLNNEQHLRREEGGREGGGDECEREGGGREVGK